MKPIYIHSGMAGAPQYANANDNINGILEACLINGFNSKTATSASASGGVLTLNFAANPGFEALQTVEVAVADVALVNGQHRVVANDNNQVTIAIVGLPDGAVGSSGAGITIKQAGAGWSKPFSASTKAVFRPPAGNRRYLRVVHTAGANAQARGYGDMTDVDTGTDPFPTAAQDATGMLFSTIGIGSSSGSAWFLIATDKWVYMAMSNSPTATQSVGSLFFGDISMSVVAGDVYKSYLKLASNGFLQRNYAGAGTAIIAAQRESDGTGATWPSVIADGAQFLPYIPVVETATNILRGVLPCAYKIYPVQPGNQFLTIHSNISGISGRLKPIAGAVQGNMNFAVAVDEEAWD